MLVMTTMLALTRSEGEEEKTRIQEIAAAIVDESRPVAFWGGEEGALATSLMLVAIGFHESKFQEKTRRCATPRRKYLGMFQILPGPNTRPYKPAEVCASDALQSHLALRILRRAREHCKVCAPAYAVRAYASGDGSVKSKEAQQILDLWSRSAEKIGLRVYPYARTSPHWIRQK